MKARHFTYTLLATIAVLLTSCVDDIERTVISYSNEEMDILNQTLNLPTQLFDYSSAMPGVTSSISTSAFDERQEIENHKATLGRVLFYDDQLSINNSVSCASCHQQSLAFADDASLSEGFDGELSLRNSLPLGNTIGFEEAYGGGSGDFGNGTTVFFNNAGFGWDEANANIASQSIAAITSSVEMGMHDMDQLRSKLLDIDYYQVLFKKAYGSKNMNDGEILDALDAFINSISSTNSRFDQGAKEKGADFAAVFRSFDNFTATENIGKQLYLESCASCHSFDHNKTVIATANNGLDLIYQDKGVGQRTGISSHDGVFKVPFLRNIALTGPYMHDGRFETLEEVVDFYSTDIANHNNLSGELQGFDGKAKKFNFTDNEKEALIAYLHTLTDEELLTEPKWSDPFK